MDPSNSKAFYRKCLALIHLGNYSAALPLLEEANRGNPSDTAVARTLRDVKEKMKEERKRNKEKEREMFGGKF